MKIEREYGRSDKAIRSTVLQEKWFHEPVYISDTPASEEIDPSLPCHLFVRRYRLLQTPSGKLRATMLLDVETFDDEAAMVAAIKNQQLAECPEDREWVPGFLLGEVIYQPVLSP